MSNMTNAPGQKAKNGSFNSSFSRGANQQAKANAKKFDQSVPTEFTGRGKGSMSQPIRSGTRDIHYDNSSDRPNVRGRRSTKFTG